MNLLFDYLSEPSISVDRTEMIAMKAIKKSLLFILALMVTACSQNSIRADISSLRKDVEFLSSDECDGRLPFSEGAEKASSYIAERMMAIGLEPVSDGSFLQEVPLAMIRTTVPETILVKTPEGPVTLERNIDFTAFTQSLEEEIDIRGAELIFAGYGIVAPEFGKNDYRNISDPSNKIAVVIVNDPGLGTGGDYFRGDAMTYYGRWTYKLEEGARQGLKGVLIIHDDRGAGYGWSVVTAGDVRYVLNDPSQKQGVCPLNGWLSKDAATQLLRRAGYDPFDVFERAKAPDFEPFSLGSTLDISMKSTFEYAESPNVVGYLPGKSDECIICSAHWDHLGHAATPVDGDCIINGATDNATGVAWLLETARLLKGRNLRRGIVFLSPTCEEKGMHGSSFYAEHPIYPMEKTVAIVNMDVIPLWGENNDVTVTGYGHSDLDSLLEEVAAAQGRYVMADPDAFNGMFYRSDQLPFMRKGVPAVFAKGWSDNRLHGKQWAEDMISDYWTRVYHKPCDETHPGTDDYRGLAQDVELFLDLILRLADSDIRPQWHPTSEFASAR